jgi:integrase
MEADMRTLKDYAENLFTLDGHWRQKRRRKGRDVIDKVIHKNSKLVENYIVPLWGNIPLKNLTPKIIDEKLTNVLSLSGKELAGGTRNGILGCLSTIFKHLIEEDITTNNPVENVFRFSSAPVNKRGILSPDEMQKLFPQNRAGLLEIWGSQKYICAFLILRDTGLRPGELRALRWADWHPKLKFFPVMKAIESGKRNKIKSTKTGSVKPAIVSDFTAGEVEHFRELLKNPEPDKFIFEQKSSVPVDSSILSKHFREGVKRAGIDRPELSPYWLRHTFNTRVLEHLPDDDVRRLMGHATPKMSQYYRHADTLSLAVEAQKISGQMVAFFASQNSPQKISV